MITVQMVSRVLNDLADRKKNEGSMGGEDQADVFNPDQRAWPGEPGIDKEPDQSHFMRYYLIPPKEEADEDNVEGGDGEEDDEDEEEGDAADENHQAAETDIPNIVAGDESS